MNKDNPTVLDPVIVVSEYLFFLGASGPAADQMIQDLCGREIPPLPEEYLAMMRAPDSQLLH